MENQPNISKITIAYYPFRGKAQISRLLCQFLHINYEDKHFNPDQWDQYKAKHKQNMIMIDLPFLQHGDFTVTGTVGIIHYILQHSSRTDLLGRNLVDKGKMDSIKNKLELLDAMLGLPCTHRSTYTIEDNKYLLFYWQKKILPAIIELEADCSQDNWFFGYSTLMDLIMYELINLMYRIIPSQQYQGKLPKLRALRSRYAQIPEIYNYQISSRAMIQYCPDRYFIQFKQQKLKNQKLSFTSTTKSNRTLYNQMDMENGK